MPARLSHPRHSEEVFEEDDDLLLSCSPSSPVFSPSSLQPMQQQQPRRLRSNGSSSHHGNGLRDSASKQHLVFVPPPARLLSSSPPSPTITTITTSSAARHKRSLQFGSGRSSEGGLQQQPRLPEMLRLRSATTENVSSTYGCVGSPKQLLSLSPSYHSPSPRRLSSTHSLKEKETLALRSPPPAKSIDNSCVYCYQVVCSLYEVGGLSLPLLEEEGEWSGHVMMRGGVYECHRLLNGVRNPQTV
ncbi:hypothetical protein PENTCL1PPCAC_22099 [Pristionchus entomophagus]|uniref:Uncharacterized protein n=1 Tax=Pristionchus entomophagus TaxID=358040 RepID=A0AAV5U1B3_9BILA|nr:hypothetical protein PENTCL1PPCAC_22099 [Pristionchus entomophagus]